MTDDTPRDPLAALVEKAIYDWTAEGPQTMAEFVADRIRPTLDATRPSGDEALRAALREAAFWLEAEARYPRADPVPAMRKLAARLRAALATPSSTPDAATLTDRLAAARELTRAARLGWYRHDGSPTVYDEALTTDQVRASVHVPADGQWHHAVLVGGVLYIDGVETPRKDEHD